MVERGEDAVGIDGARRCGEGEAGRHQGVLHLEFADERQAQIPGPAGEQDPGGLREPLVRTDSTCRSRPPRPTVRTGRPAPSAAAITRSA